MMLSLKQKTFLIAAALVVAVSIPTQRSVSYAQDSNQGSLSQFDKPSGGGTSSSGSSGQNCWHSVKEMEDTPSNMSNFDWQMCSSADQTNPGESTQAPVTTSPSDFCTGLNSVDGQNLSQFDKPGSSPSLSVPTLNQNDPANGALGSKACGPTALAMIADYYGLNASVPELIQMAGTTGVGTPINVLATVAQEIGLTDTVSNTGSSIGNIGSDLGDAFFGGSSSYNTVVGALANGNPVIVNVDLDIYSGGHAMVVTGISGGEVYVNNPFNGQQEAYGEDQFMSMWGSEGYKYVIPKP